jgi:uncharacterized membrane protein (DUF2068 family)
MSAFLIRRALTLGALVFAVLTVVELVEGEGLFDALAYAGLWAVLSAAVFAIVQMIRDRRGASCAVCEDEVAEEDDPVLHA